VGITPICAKRGFKQFLRPPEGALKKAPKRPLKKLTPSLKEKAFFLQNPKRGKIIKKISPRGFTKSGAFN